MILTFHDRNLIVAKEQLSLNNTLSLSSIYIKMDKEDYGAFFNSTISLIDKELKLYFWLAGTGGARSSKIANKRRVFLDWRVKRNDIVFQDEGYYATGEKLYSDTAVVTSENFKCFERVLCNARFRRGSAMFIAPEMNKNIFASTAHLKDLIFHIEASREIRSETLRPYYEDYANTILLHGGMPIVLLQDLDTDLHFVLIGETKRIESIYSGFPKNQQNFKEILEPEIHDILRYGIRLKY